MKLRHIALAGGALLSANAAYADVFVNGGFENGTASGWTTAGGSRTGLTNTQLASATLTGATRGEVIASTYVDPHLGSKIGSTVYSGNFGYRVEDTTTGGLASVISQRVNNYSDSNIFFAWKSVLEGAHDADTSATMIIRLTDLTTNTVLITRQYNAASGGGGVDPRFTYDASTNYFYTANWQIEQLAIGANLQGHDFLLSVLGSDCQPSGHAGYVYLDGFGAVTPPPVTGSVPEPTTWAMMIAGFGLMGASMRRRSTKVAFA